MTIAMNEIYEKNLFLLQIIIYSEMLTEIEKIKKRNRRIHNQTYTV